MMEIQKIPNTFTKNSFTYKQVARAATKAIYAQYDGDRLIAWEIIKIRVRPPRYNKFLKRTEPAREIYPTTGQWGKMGWTYANWENDTEKSWKRAIEKYNNL